MRKKLLVANWKLNHHRQSARDFIASLTEHLDDSLTVDLAIAPVAPMLEFVGACIDHLPIALAAQNVFYESHGPYTGEWAASHLRELNVRYCIVGHSERRFLFGETDEVVFKKAQACWQEDIDPIICIGENYVQRQADQTEEVIERQVNAILLRMTEAQKKPLLFAYEPIWAIGTGITASTSQVEETHRFIRNLLAKNLGVGLAERSRILYGGSVNAQNIGGLAANSDVDGALVGGASLQADSFLSMVKALHDLRSF